MALVLQDLISYAVLSLILQVVWLEKKNNTCLEVQSATIVFCKLLAENQDEVKTYYHSSAFQVLLWIRM